MKKTILFGAALLFNATVFSQVFSDDFDGYTAGDYLVSSNPVDWDTWSGGAGGSAEDVKISSEEAASGDNSIRFQSTSANGGPSDIILRFDQVYDAGHFVLDANFFVVQNKGAYFNLQQDHNVGSVWAIDCHLLQDGTLHFSNSGTEMLTANYPTGEWFNLKMDIDLTSNEWEIFVDDVSQGSFSNPVNSIGILDIFPVNPAGVGGNNQSEFYVDDVSYNHTPAALPPLNGGVTFVSQLEGLVGQNAEVIAKIRNLGVDEINSFDLSYTYGGGASETESISGLNLPSLDFYEFTFPTSVTLLNGSNDLTVTISNVNGAGQDGDPSDDAKTVNINPVSPAAGKIVVGEEGTGTWCGWCPRGAVFMDYMADKYDGFWAGIAVHNNDPMTDAVYDAGIGGKISGYPSALVDRGSSIDPSEMEADFIDRIVIEPKAVINNGAQFDPATRELEVTLTYSFNSAVSGNWRTACVLTEDGVTGSGSGFAQNNSYAGGGSGEMGGYELLNSPVPASQMVYDHVARGIAPSFAGEASLFPSSISAGDEHTICYTFTLPEDWDESKMHIVGLLIDGAGKINNAGYTTISEAESNGLTSCDATTDLELNEFNEKRFNIYPNPATNVAYIEMFNSKNEEVELTITDLTGKTFATRSYVLDGDVKLPINTGKLAKGTYIVSLKQKGSVQQRKLIVR